MDCSNGKEQKLKKVLFLCTRNSCRSQMAEGFAKHLLNAQVYSAGTQKYIVDPLSIKVMAEKGIDISSQYSKTIQELPQEPFDYMFTLCSSAKENCPVYFNVKHKEHHGFDDPAALAQTAKTEEEKLNIYRRVRDEIEAFIITLKEVFNNNTQG